MPARVTQSGPGPCDPSRGEAFAGAECGTIRVFENRNSKRGRIINVAYARWPAARQPAAGAVFLIPGGPGASGASAADDVERWARPLRATLDLVVMDQRGTGQSNPLFCAHDVESQPQAAFGHIFDPAWVRECRTNLEGKADLTQYTTDAAAADLEDVRHALGYEQIGVYGGSYGTRLAQAYVRRFPDRVRAVVLDGVMPFDRKVPLTYAATAQQALDRAIDGCAADAECRRSHPNLRADFTRLLARFQNGPVRTTVTPPGRAPVTVMMSRGDFGYTLRGILYSPALTRDLPAWITHAAATGDVSAFAQRYWQRALDFRERLAHGLHWSVLCAEDTAFITDAEIDGATARTFLGRYVVDEYRSACALWPVAQVPAELRRPLSTSVATLLVSGYFDPVTPPEFAAGVASSLSTSRHLVAPRSGHGSVGACPLEAALFLLRSSTLTGMPDACR